MDKKIPVVPIKAAGQTDVTDDIMNTIIKISPYICILLAILLIISLVSQMMTSSEATTATRAKPTYSGNKSLDTLYTDAHGNDPSKAARMTSQISLSTDEYSCKFGVTYEGDNYRDVNCITGCSLEAEPAEDSENKENEEFCNQYRYSAIEADKRGNLLNRMLDDEYLNRMNIVNQGGSGGD